MLPPLRERREDIPLLAGVFLNQHAKRYRKPVDRFDEKAMRALLDYHWPGNVRELDHAIERAVLMSGSRSIAAGDLSLRRASEVPPRLEDMSLEEVEYVLVRKALKKFDGNVSRAAEALGLSRSALYRRLQRFGL
jgi:DNA-binding NtrC family response regulator